MAGEIKVPSSDDVAEEQVRVPAVASPFQALALIYQGFRYLFKNHKIGTILGLFFFGVLQYLLAENFEGIKAFFGGLFGGAVGS